MTLIRTPDSGRFEITFTNGLCQAERPVIFDENRGCDPTAHPLPAQGTLARLGLDGRACLCHNASVMRDVQSGRVVLGVEAAIGNTPLARLQRLAPENSAELFAKLEMLNPSGSIKDRVALAAVLDAEDRGLLRPGAAVVEATSGNAGPALAMVGAARGYRAIIVMPSDVPDDAKRRVQSYGAEVVQSPSIRGMIGATERAQELVRDISGAFLMDQFSNPACLRAHQDGTGQEILDAFGDRTVDAFVAAVGTGATLMGVGQALKGKNPSTAVIAIEPSRSMVLSQGVSGPHRIVGIGADFVPAHIRRELIDEILQVSDDEAFEMAGLLASKEGLFVGPSSGANVAIAIGVAKRLGPGRCVVTVLPDVGDRYVRASR